MQTTMNRITRRNGFRLNGNPALMSDVQSIFEERVTAKNGSFTSCAKQVARKTPVTERF